MRASSLVALLALSCARATSEPTEAVPGQPVQLAAGEAVRVSGTTVEVRFTGANDSRCPSDVTCVTAGDAGIILAFSGAGAERIDTLWLVRQPRMTVYGAHRFEATALNPYPRSTGTGGTKVLTLRVDRAN